MAPSLRSWVTVVVGLALVGCIGDSQASVPLEPREDEVDERLEARCGAVVMPVTEQPVFPAVPINSAAQTLLDEGTFVGFDPGGYEWFISVQTEARVLLFGRPAFPVGTGEPEFADVLFEKRQAEWELTDFGRCRLEVVAPGFGPGRWILDPAIAPEPDSSQLSILTMERSCASGRPPVGREVLPVVVEQTDRVIITISVEPVVGGADCPGNPWHPIVVELEQPIADRAFLDGNTFPPIERPWPPTQSSLSSLGDP